MGQFFGFLTLLNILISPGPLLRRLEHSSRASEHGSSKQRGGNPIALAAAAYMLAVSLPRMLIRLVTTAEDGASGEAAEATADAGDEVVALDATP